MASLRQAENSAADGLKSADAMLGNAKRAMPTAPINAFLFVFMTVPLFDDVPSVGALSLGGEKTTVRAVTKRRLDGFCSRRAHSSTRTHARCNGCLLRPLPVTLKRLAVVSDEKIGLTSGIRHSPSGVRSRGPVTGSTREFQRNAFELERKIWMNADLRWRRR